MFPPPDFVLIYHFHVRFPRLQGAGFFGEVFLASELVFESEGGFEIEDDGKPILTPKEVRRAVKTLRAGANKVGFGLSPHYRAPPRARVESRVGFGRSVLRCRFTLACYQLQR